MGQTGLKQTRGNRDGPLDIEILRTGVLLSAHQARHQVGALDPLPVGVPVGVGVANAEGAAANFARRDHVHEIPTINKEVLIRASPPNAILGRHSGYNLPDAANTTTAVEWLCPHDFVTLIEPFVIVIPSGTGNIYFRANADYAGSGELYNVHNETGNYVAFAVVLNRITVIPCSLSLATLLGNLSVGDVVGLTFGRDATNVLDTVNAAVLFVGFLIRYNARINLTL